MGFLRVSERLTYANVAGTVALFIALGGASYAAISVPANSVGTRDLAFPLGATSSTAEFTQRLLVQQCGIDQSCPPPPLTTLRSVTIDLKRPGRLLVLGSADMLEASPTASPVQVDLSAERANSAAGATSGEVGQQASPLQFWQLVSAPAGRQVLRLQASAQSGASDDQTVLIDVAQLDVLALPRLK